MLEYEWNSAASVLVVRPTGPLGVPDFETLSTQFAVAVKRAGRVRGLLIDLPAFPGWQGVRGVRAHVRFIAQHHRLIARVAIVTDSLLLRFGPPVANLLLHPKVRRFRRGEQTAALDWLRAR
jgi:hypothetical protein